MTVVFVDPLCFSPCFFALYTPPPARGHLAHSTIDAHRKIVVVVVECRRNQRHRPRHHPQHVLRLQQFTRLLNSQVPTILLQQKMGAGPA